MDKAIITKKIEELELYLKELERLKILTLDDIKKSKEKAWSVEHGLQLSIQIVIDVGNHILASISENQIEDYADIIDKLGEHSIVPIEFAEKIRDMAGFRNILVHDYIKLDLSRLYDILQNRLGDFKQFIEYIKKYIKI